MLQSLRDRARSEGGFTLIELLVVILIIGILATLAIPRFLGQRDSANDTKAKNAVRTAISTAETFFAQNQTYVGLTASVFSGIETSVTFSDTALTAGASPTAGAVGTFAAAGDPAQVQVTAAPTATTIQFCAASKSTKVFCARLNSAAATNYYASVKAPATLPPTNTTADSTWTTASTSGF